jgi:hypothetical protein
MIRARWLLALVVLVAVDRVAAASVLRCWGTMRTADCRETNQTWPAASQPTFGVGCEGCGHAADGGSVCVPVGPGPSGFSLRVSGRSYSSQHFEVVGTDCGNETLYRYKGPLDPGARHEIVYPGNADDSRPVPYVLAFDVEAAVPVDAGADALTGTDVPRATDAATRGAGDAAIDPRAARAGGGCTHAAGDPAPAAVVLLLAAALLGRGVAAYRRRHGSHLELSMSRRRRPHFALLLAALLPLWQACEPTGCHVRGCTSAVQMEVVVGNTPRSVLASFTITLCRNASCHSASLSSLPDSLTPGAGFGLTFEPPPAPGTAPPVSAAVFLESDGSTRVRAEWTQAAVRDPRPGDRYSVTLRDQDRTIASHEETVAEYMTERPNGEDCAPTCAVARFARR